jgi:hypothetical protein
LLFKQRLRCNFNSGVNGRSVVNETNRPLTADIIAPTAQEIQALAEEEEVDQELEDAIADVVLISRGGRQRKATQKAVESAAQSSKRRRLY